MITEFGHVALILALCVSVVQSTVPLAGAARGNDGWMAVGRNAALIQFALVALAMLALMHAYVTSDFSVINVIENSHTDKPLLYKVTGVWGNHEGSMLLWIFMLGVCSAALALFSGNLPPDLRARVLAVQGMIAAGFTIFILLTSNPFLRAWPPAENGHGLNPVLQDPGLAFHPPFLYLGYVGFSVAFSFAVAALIEGRVDAAWARWVRPWSLASWCFLTVGIAMGSWWAYYTLGWGGWWFWDPVENASFMPWLVGTALIHSAIVVERRDTLKSWTILLAIVTFSLSLVGTFLVRSGVLSSVHAFAVDPWRGSFILLLLVVAIGGSLTLYAIRAPALKAGGLFAPVSREGALLLNNLLLTACAATVFLGTLYPLFLDAVGGAKVSVGPPFFDRTFVPMMIPALTAMAVGPMLSWKRGDLLGALQRLWIAFAVAAGFTLIMLYVTYGGPVLAVLGLGLAIWTAMGVIVEFAERVRLFRAPLPDTFRRTIHLPRAAIGMTFAHFGMAVSVAGISATGFETEHLAIVPVGGGFRLSGYDFHFDKVENVQGPNFVANHATIEVHRDGRLVAVAHPERRYFALQDQTTSVTAIRSSPISDLYLALGDPAPNGGWTIRAYWKPMISWIWGGALIMAFGGVVSLSDRRWRVGAAARPHRPPVPQPAAAE
jgi:cytochrome c-type biogenesis protein CcmF